MKRITMVFVWCIIYLFLVLLNLGFTEDKHAKCAEDCNRDFQVVFPKGHFVDLDGNPPLVLSWYDPQTQLKDPDAYFGVNQSYKVSISEDEFFEELICVEWISNKSVWVLSDWIVKEIGLERGRIYYWKAQKVSQSQGCVVSTDTGSFVDDSHIMVGWNVYIWGAICDDTVVQVYSHTGPCENSTELLAEFIPYGCSCDFCLYSGFLPPRKSYCVHYRDEWKTFYGSEVICDFWPCE